MSRFRIGKRKKQRTKMVVPIRVLLAEPKGSAPQMAHTLDATENGVRLAGFQGELKVGDTIEIQHQHKRALFRVVWIKAVGKSSEKQVGAECMEPNRDIWAVEFPHKPDEYEERE